MTSYCRFMCVLLVAIAGILASPQRLPSQEPQTPPLDPEAKKAVGRLLKNLFGEISEKAQELPADGETPTPDPIDERAVVNREQRTQLQRAERMLEEGQRGAGLRLLQYLLNADEDSLLLTNEGQWRSLHAVTEEIILQSDEKTRREYRQRYAKIAEERLQEARRKGSVRALANVTRRYFATPAGAEAADEIASLMIDAGEPAEAAYWYQRLIDGEAEIAQDPLWRRNAARICERAARPSDSVTHPASVPQDQADSLEERPLRSATPNSTNTEWTQPFGGPAHTGRTVACDPVLRERWSQSLTDRPENVEQITRLVEDLQDNGKACVPASIPLAVDGKILYRNLRGLSVIDASSGRRLWESPESVSIERLLAGESVSRPATETGTSRLRPMSNYQGNGADQHALTNLLFRDGVYGFVSSDGERVFVLEDHATLSYRPPGYYRGRSRDDDPHGRDWETNRLSAYDLDTGRRVWSVGGPDHNEPFSPELAGTLFQGPPVIEGDELFVIGEQHGAENLFVLDRHTGRLLWTQMLSGVSAEIEYDLVRRWWPALPAVGKGVIICPTTVGWVVAVDRHERRIRWAQRLTERRKEQRYSRQSSVATTSPLNSRWSPSAPMLVGNRVIIAPAELPDPEYHTSPRVIGLETLTGEPRWEREKETLLYLGGVAGNALLLVGRDRVEARDVSDGRRLWRVPIPEASGVPSGRGVITGDDFLLPLQSGQLWRIRLSDGSVIAKSMLPDDHRPLGNLLVHRKQLISLTPFGVTGFEDRETVERLLASTDDASLEPRDQLRAAELQALEGNHRTAVEQLREIDLAALAPAAAEETRELHRTSLVAVIRRDPSSAVGELADLEQLAESEQDRLTVRQLQAERETARGDHAAAFAIYWKLAQEPDNRDAAEELPVSQSESNVTLIEDGETSVRRDRWLSARLEEAWIAMSPDARQQVDQRIKSTVDTLLQNPAENGTWWAHVLRFHPEGRRIEDRMAQLAIDAGRLGEAEVRLLRLLDDRSPPEARSETLRQLVTLLDRRGRTDDSDANLARFANTIAAADPAVGEKLRRWEQQRRQRGDTSVGTTRQGDWSSDEFSVSRMTMLYNRQSSQTSLAVVGGLPSLDRFQFLLQPGLQRLNVDSVDGQRYCETPLRSLFHTSDNQTDFAGTVGQVVLLIHRGVLHALSLPDRELLWQRPLDDRTQYSASLLRSNALPPDEMASAQSFQTGNGLTRQRNDFNILAVARPEYLCYSGRNSLTAADPLTGETLWIRHGIRPQSLVVGTNRHLFVIPPAPAHPFALRVSDGTRDEVPHLESTLSSAIGVSDNGLVTLHLDGFGEVKRDGNTVDLARIDPETSEPDWKMTFPGDTLFTRLETDTLLAIEPDGTVRLVNWAQRDDRVLGTLDPDQVQDARSIYAIADRHQIYLSLSERPDRRYRSEIFLSMPVNGPLIAIDRTNGGILWQREIEDQNLLLERLHQLPVLVMLSRETTVRRPGHNAQQVHLQMLDKRDGTSLLDSSRYVSLGSFRSLDVDLTARVIDFQGSRERLRIQPSDVEPVSGE